MRMTPAIQELQDSAHVDRSGAQRRLTAPREQRFLKVGVFDQLLSAGREPCTVVKQVSPHQALN